MTYRQARELVGLQAPGERFVNTTSIGAERAAALEQKGEAFERRLTTPPCLGSCQTVGYRRLENRRHKRCPLYGKLWPMLSRSALQITLNSSSGSGSRRLDKPSVASCRSSMLGRSEISTIVRRTASAVATTAPEAKSLIRLIKPMRRCSSLPSASSSRMYALRLGNRQHAARSRDRYPSAEGRLPKGLSFGESDVIDDEVRARSVHKVGNGHKFDGASAASLVA